MTKGYFLAILMLAAAAAGVVWIAIRQQPHATAVPEKASSEPAVSVSSPVLASPSMAVASSSAVASAANDDAQVGDASTTATDADAGDTPTFPALTTNAAWSVVRWDMSLGDAEAALRDAGVNVARTTDAKLGTKRLRATRGPWEATIDFRASGASEVVVTSTSLSKDAAQEVIAKTSERAPATKNGARAERRWKKDGGASASFVTRTEGTTVSMREEHVRERSPGGFIGFAGLRWGMSTQEVVGQLTGAGWVPHVPKPVAMGIDPCAMPNPASDCAKQKGVTTVTFTKGDVEGLASFNQFGLRQVELSGPISADGAAARAKEIESALGKPAYVEASTKTEHHDFARHTSIEVEVTERTPGGVTVSETYRPKN